MDFYAIYGKFEDEKMHVIEIYKVFEVEYLVEEKNLDIIFLEKLKKYIKICSLFILYLKRLFMLSTNFIKYIFAANNL